VAATDGDNGIKSRSIRNSVPTTLDPFQFTEPEGRMFGLPVQRRKVTTYGKATRPASYSLLRDEPPPDKSKPRDSDWQNDQKRTPLERAPPPTLATGRFVRPAPKPPLDTTWDVPSSDDEAAQPPASSSRPTKSSASSKVGKETIRSNVGQQRSPGLTRQPVVGQVQKRKKEISGRTAPQRAPDVSVSPSRESVSSAL